MINKKLASKKLRELFINVVQKQADNHKKVGLLLSGGIDSVAILYSLFELDIQVQPYTFYMENYISSDLKSSRELCKKYNLPLIEVETPRGNIVNDFKKLYQLGCFRKTHFETRIHYLHTFPKVNEQILFYGLNADNWYGVERDTAIRGSKDFEEFKKIRCEILENSYKINLPLDQNIASQYNIQLCDPYADEMIFNFFQQFDWKYLNQPYQKWIMINAFEDYFREDGFRKHKNFQIASGMREYCKTLLNDPNININNKTSPIGLYNDLMRRWDNE